MSSLPTLQHLALGHWTTAAPGETLLTSAIDGSEVARLSAGEPDTAAMLAYAREVGNPNLRRMTFHERGRMLKALALHLLAHKEAFYAASWATGATRADAWIDIEGGIGNLFSYASLRRRFPDTPFALDGDGIALGKQGTFGGHHLLVPKEGVAIHINAFNFPVWGMLEKLAVNWLAGVPAVVKPASATSFLTEAVAREIHRSGILPEGALQIVCGPARGLLDTVDERDVVTFTGSAATGRLLKAHPRVVECAVPFNLEADSLNAAVLGTTVQPGDPEYALFIKEIRKEIAVKAGQKCTAVRRIIVPSHLIDQVQQDLAAALDQTVFGDPRIDGVRMGALVNRGHLADVETALAQLAGEMECVYRSEREPVGGDAERGAFMGPRLFRTDAPFAARACHEVEAFGPVATLMPYTEVEEAAALARKGRGSLCCSLTSHDPGEQRDFVLQAAPMHGRILVLDRDCAAESTGHGSPLPLLVHGGPGRAGGGEEMGGIRGVHHYMQRTAIQGSPSALTAITSQYQVGGAQTESEPHVFRKYFEDLAVGDTVTTAKHTVTEADIVNFANVSGDHFYAHVDATSLEGTVFERRVAHGYYILSKAAGLFVEPRKGPVLLNYGIEEARFTKPVYPGSTIGVRLTVREKVAQEQRDRDDIPKGIVKFLVDVYDETGETVALATILTMVRQRTPDAEFA